MIALVISKEDQCSLRDFMKNIHMGTNMKHTNYRHTGLDIKFSWTGGFTISTGFRCQINNHRTLFHSCDHFIGDQFRGRLTGNKSLHLRSH